MKTKLRILSLLIALVMCFSLFAGCAKEEDSSDRDDEAIEEEDKGNKNDKDDKGDKNEEGNKNDDKIDVKKDPHGAVMAAFSKIAADLIGDTANVSKVFTDASKGTAEYSFGLDFEGAKATVDLVADAKNAAFNGKVSVGYDNVSTSANVWFNDDVVVKAPAILGDNAYGFKLSTFKDDLDKSPLLEAMDYDSADELIDDLISEFETGADMSLDEIEEIMGTFTDVFENTAEVEEEFEKEMNKVFKGIDADVAEEDDTYKITFTVTEKNVKAFVMAYVDLFTEIYGDLFEITGQDVDDIFGDVEDSLDEMQHQEVPFDFYLDKKTGELVRISLDFENSDDGDTSAVSANIEFEDGKITGKFETNYSGEYYEESESVDIVFESVNKSGSKGFEITINDKGEFKDLEDSDYDYDYDTEGKMSFIRDKKGNFTFALSTDGEEEIVIEGVLNYDSKSFEFGLTSIESYGETIEGEISFSVEVGGKVEKAPKYKNVLTMTEDDWMDLAETVQNSSIIEELGGLMDGLNSYDDYDDEYYDDEYYDDYDDEYYDDEYYDDYEF